MASGHRKRKAALVRTYALSPAGLASYPAGETANGTINAVNISLYSSGGYSPTFKNDITAKGALSDSISNKDGTWTLVGLTGETTNAGVFVSSSLSGAVGHSVTSVEHYWFPKPGTAQLDRSGSSDKPSGSLIVYTGDGPQSNYVPYYLGALGTGSIKFGTTITGSGSPTHVVVYVGGKLATGDQIRALKASDGTTVLQGKLSSGSSTTFSSLSTLTCTASAAELSANLYRKVFLIPTGNIASASGMIIEFSSSGGNSITQTPGVFVVISSGSYS